jgi:hypothetical protein
LLTTLTELIAIAAAARTGLSRMPRQANSAPAATGMSRIWGRPTRTLLDGGDGAPGQSDRGDDAAQVATDEGDVGGGDATSAPVPMATDVRAGQCGRVVDAVADHGDHVPGGLQRADLLGLLVRQHWQDGRWRRRRRLPARWRRCRR